MNLSLSELVNSVEWGTEGVCCARASMTTRSKLDFGLGA